MPERPTDPTIDPRVEAYLAAELAQAERDAPRLPAIPAPRRDRVRPLAALAVGAGAIVVAIAFAGPGLLGGATSPSPTPSASGTKTPAPGASGLMARPSPDTVTPIDRASLSAGGLTLTLEFVGGREYDPGKLCSNAYEGWAEEADGVLYAAVVDVTPDPPTGASPATCTAEGYPRSVSVALEAPYRGERMVDIGGGVYFLREPPGLVELRGLPEGWELRSSGSSERSDIGRWHRVYSPYDPPPEGSAAGRLELIQAFGGAAGVAGGDLSTKVMVGDHPGVLYRSPSSGELVLVWMLGDNGIGLVTNEADFTPDELIELAETADQPSGPLGVISVPFANRELELTIAGAPGVVAGWRAAGEGELDALTWNADGDIGFHRLSDTELVIAWLGTVCDVKAALTVAPGRILIRPAPRGGCDSMGVARGVVLTFAEPVDPAAIEIALEEPARQQWGPLAVLEPQGGADTALTEGTLRITEECVYLTRQDESVLLLWPSDHTTWDPEAHTITFAGTDASSVTIRGGDVVALGGSGMSRAEDGALMDGWLAGLSWVAAPADTCLVGSYWVVGDVTR